MLTFLVIALSIAGLAVWFNLCTDSRDCEHPLGSPYHGPGPWL